MAITLTEELKNEIKSKADIIDVISYYPITVTKQGKLHVCVCPFHDDHDPSLKIYQDKQTATCFVCGRTWDVFGFVQDYEKVSFIEAVEKVCQIIGFDDPRLHESKSNFQVSEDVQVLYNCINDLQKFYEYALTTQEGEAGMNYLNSRQLSGDQIKKFGIGYAFEDGRKAITFLHEQKGYSLKNIQDIGIALNKGNDTSDSNAGRVIFPIKNSNGQVCGFSARALGPVDDGKKYVNTTQTKIFTKNNLLYNLHRAKNSCKHDGYIYVLEGFMDVIALDAIGIESAVAVMGKEITSNHIKALKRLGVEIRLCLDNDKAGQTAMMKNIPVLEENGIKYRVVSKPDEKMKDTDDILKKEGPDQLKAYVESLVEPFDFVMNYCKNYAPLRKQESKRKVIDQFAPMLTKVTDVLVLQDYLHKLSEVTGYHVDAIKQYLKDIKNSIPETNSLDSYIEEQPKFDASKIDKAIRRWVQAERQLVQIMLFDPNAVAYFEKKNVILTNDVYRTLAYCMLDLREKGVDIDKESVIEAISETDDVNKSKVLFEIETFKNPNISNEDLSEYLNDCSNVIMEERNKNNAKKRIRNSQESGESLEEKAKRLNDFISELNRDSK